MDSDKQSQNGRIYNLLEQYGIQDRIVEDETIFNYSSRIDYKKLWKIMDENRNRSRKWLKEVMRKL